MSDAGAPAGVTRAEAMDDFGQIYETEYPRVFAYLMQRARHRQIAEDLAHDVFLHAWEAYSRWEDRGIPYSHYLRRIAHWRHGLYWKKEKRRRRHWHYYPYLHQHDLDSAMGHDGGIGAVLDRVESAVAYAFLEAALRKLRPRPLRAIALRYGLGLQELEAGRRMGLGRQAYRAVRRGAIERLQQIMLGQEPTWTAKNAKKRTRQ